MKIEEIYVCEKCGEKFDSYNKCETHEFKCCDKRKLFEDNIENVIHKTKQMYGSFIIDSNYSIEDDSFLCEGNFHYCYHFEINFELANGNKVVIYDGMDEDLWLGNYLEEEIILKSTKREIEKCIPTKFEGEIYWKYDDNWRNDYIGELEIHDIVDRLRGRKVRLEVID